MEHQEKCYCGSGISFDTCCRKFLELKAFPETAEELMRSRYSAYVLANAKYIVDTTHPKTRHFHSKKAILEWSKENVWQKLEVVKAEGNQVVFKAYFKDRNGSDQIHWESSVFERLGGRIYYVSGSFNEE